MRKKLLTKHCALLLLALLAAWSTQAWADVTINVKAPSAPHMYVWNSSQTPLNGQWPGGVVTDTKVVNGETYYTKTISNENTVSVIFAKNNDTQTGDFSGLTGEVFFHYNGETLAYGNLPDDVAYESSGYFVYFVNTKNWNNVYAHIFDNNNNSYRAWPGTEMTRVHTDGGNQSVYKFGPITDCSITPTQIVFTNNSGKQTADLEFRNGGYYVYSEYNNGANNRADLVAVIDASRIKNTATYFADSHFREGITKSLGVAEGAAFTPADYTILDLSYDSETMTGKISNLSGIEHFTNLEELYVQDNNLTSNVDLKNNKKLQILNISGNSAITGFSANHTPYVDINFGNGSNTTNLKELYCANCSIFYAGGLQYNVGLKVLSMPHNVLDYFDATNTMGKLSNLEYLDMSYNKLTSQQSLSHNPKLVYVDVSENPTFNSYFAHLENLTQLKTFKASNCKLTADQTKYSNTHGYFPNESVEYVDVSNNPALNTMYVPATNNLKTIIANGCTGLGGSSSSLALSPTSGGTYLPRLTHLERLELNNVDLYLNTNNQTYGLFNILTPSVATNLNYIDLSNDQLGTSSKPTFAFPKLETLLLNGNPGLTQVTVTDLESPENFQLDVTGDASLTSIAINNSGLTSIPTIISTGATSLYKLDLTDNAFTDVPTTGISTLTTLVMNNNQLSDINVSESNINYLYAQNNNFGSGDYTLPTTSLVGLDLGNNGFTKFKAENNTSLKSLALAGNTSLTEIELHGNTALTQTSPDGVIESDNGLYIKGLSNLQTLNIENSKFNKLGQQNSLEGCTGLTKLQARHNEFTTFTNGVYALDVAGTGNYRKPDNTESSLEHLVGLEYLDLAYNNLQDSVHLYKNVALKHLDVSHNNEIHGVIDGTITADNTAAQEAMRTKKAKRLVKYGMYYGDKGELTDALFAQACADQAGRQVRFDIRYEDLNDTTGIYHLDLQKNVNLEWIDISYTNIHNTAAGPGVMNPGWMSRDWVGDSDEALAATVHANTTTQRSYSAFHTFVYFAPCSKLKTIHMDHCNMQSLGVSYFPELDTLTASYMYGDCAFMRDATKTDLRYGMANTGPGRVRKYLSPKTNTETGIQDAVNVVGPDGTPNTYFDNNIKYYDISYSGFNELRLNYGINLEYIDVSGNPLKFHVHPNSDYSYHNSLDVTYCPNVRTVIAENCSDLPIVRAHNRSKLDTLYVSNDPNLKVLYVQNDPVLKDNFVGLNTLTGLETLFGYNNTQWGNDINFSSNTALKNLWISNIGTSSINVANNANLEKLRAYDNSLTALDLSNNGELLWLDVARNKLPEIDLSSNSKLQFFNISNGSDTRTQLDGTEVLNHDGSDGDATYPTTIFSADEAPIANANNGNSLSDLALPASIIDARANGNDLHSITGNFANLTNMEFAHNHINGIDLSEASGATIDSRDNGRTILADCAKFLKKENGVVQEYTVYFFQLDPNVTGNGTVLTLKDSKDLKDATRYLGEDGLVMDNITWDGTSGSALKNTITPGDMSVLDPDEVPGNIVVLNPSNESGNGADGTATYTYKTGENSTSEFYLNWSSDGTITAISEIKAEGGVSITNTYGNLTVTGADGAVVGVYDLNGRQVASETITDGKVVITGLTPGIYLVNGMKVLVK